MTSESLDVKRKMGTVEEYEKMIIYDPDSILRVTKDNFITLFAQFIKNGRKDLVELAIKHKIHERVYIEGYIQNALETENVEITELLIIAKGERVLEYHAKMTLLCLYFLYRVKSMEMLHMLLKYSDLKSEDRLGQTSLFRAVSAGRHDTFHILVKSGADVNHRDNNGRTAIFLAVGVGDIPAIESLIGLGADLTMRDIYGKGLLNYCIRHTRNKEVAEKLIGAGVHVDSFDREGHTPLHDAVLMPNSKWVEYLLSKGASVDFRAKGSYTLLDIANIHKMSRNVHYFREDGSCRDVEMNTIIELLQKYKTRRLSHIAERIDAELPKPSPRNRNRYIRRGR